MSTKSDDRSDNLLAAGALVAALMKGGVKVEIPTPITNSCTVRFEFLKSAYKVTIERIPGTEIDK